MAAPAKPEASAPAKATPAADAAAAHAPAAAGGIKAWLPVIVALLVAPAATWAVVEFVLVPRLQKKLAAASASAGEHGEPGAPAESHAPTAPAAAPAHGGKPGKEGKESKGGGGPGFEFTNVVVNLAGTMGTRYLKTSFLITGADPNIRTVFENAKPKVTDVTLNVLSSLTLADIEEAGSKNIIREKLVTAYNQALGRKVAEQVYFSDFVVQ